MQHETKNRKSANGDFIHEFLLCAVLRDGTNMSKGGYLFVFDSHSEEKNLIKTDRKRKKNSEINTYSYIALSFYLRKVHIPVHGILF